MENAPTLKTTTDFLYNALGRVWTAAGGMQEDAHYIADAIVFAHLQGKLNQGLGVFEAVEIALAQGLLDLGARPKIVSESDSWAVVDGQRASGYWCLNVMADTAIQKAKGSGIAIVFGGNHNDAGSFARYVFKAFEQDMLAFSSNNSVPLAAPFGGMFNRLSCPPFDAIAPAGEKPPIWASVALAEFYDADVAESYFENKPLKGEWLIDPKSGELSSDVRPYARPLEGYGRVADCTAAGQIAEPRTYALNMWLESLSSIINPLGIASTDLPTVEDVASGNFDSSTTTVGGSFYICIDPSAFGPIESVKSRSDNYVSSLLDCPPRPGHSVRVPGQVGYERIKIESKEIEVITAHWRAFFDHIAPRYGVTELQIRQEFESGQTFDQL